MLTLARDTREVELQLAQVSTHAAARSRQFAVSQTYTMQLAETRRAADAQNQAKHSFLFELLSMPQ